MQSERLKFQKFNFVQYNVSRPQVKYVQKHMLLIGDNLISTTFGKFYSLVVSKLERFKINCICSYFFSLYIFRPCIDLLSGVQRAG